MKNLSTQTQLQIAIQTVVMDAIEKGFTSTEQLIEYMNSDVFKIAVKNYISLFSEDPEKQNKG